MSPYKSILLTLIMTLTLTGCEGYSILFRKFSKKPEKPPKKVVQKVDDIDLAKMLLKPERRPMDIPRDPFMPIIEEGEAGGPQQSQMSPIEQQIRALLQSIEFDGVVKVRDEYSALLRIDGKRGVYHKNDMIDLLRIESIEEDHVVLRHEDNEYTIQRNVNDEK